MTAPTLATALPLLRSPPFPGVDAAVSRPGPVSASAPSEPDAIDRLFAAICEARVGGRFWATPAAETGRLIVRAGSASEIAPLRAMLDEADQPLFLLPADDLDPWSLLVDDAKLHAHGDDEWAALAHIAGCAVSFLSAGRFGAPGSAPADLRATVLAELYGRSYRNPFTGADAAIEVVVGWLADWRRTFAANRGIVSACGIAWWKRHEIARFLWTPAHPLRFFWSERRAIAHAAMAGGAVAVWPSRISPSMAQAASAKSVPIVRVEDGFVRSVGLGSDLVPPSSVAVDHLGIHYDPTHPSDLEEILAEADFPPDLLARAERLRDVILAAGISKYGGDEDHAFPHRQPGRRLVLVPGQVEDDMSVRLGGGGLASNLELLRRTRALEPEAEIWFRPHPDVDAGHRKGAVRDADALAHADRIVRGGGMARLLDRVDAVHVLTSLTGFEALLRGRDVTCHGMPFYAGWGLTRDLGAVPVRRGRVLTVPQLIAAVLIVYPRYLDPATGLPCPPEILIRRMTDGGDHNRLGWVTRLRRLQGKLSKRL
jgi:capsular polysaccharide export protein